MIELDREQKIKVITDLVDKAIDGDIYKLQVGCRVRTKYKHSTKYSYGYLSDKPFNIFSLKDSGGYPMTKRSETIPEGWENIGRPVTLEDVLRSCSLDILGQISDVTYKWEWGKPLHEQDDKVIDFIYDELT